ncbi:type 1 glutamine amidotransferase [Natronomonas marina]|uniref:type 1 glutamine amidotransferase n=1 Tax=Natronomonas marina TaxID=2961939 RepID=UPI0020C9A2C1|nr:type 1 glutamine amidotransferase [Natronomonas marina]
MTARIALVNASYDGTNTLRNFRRELDADVTAYSALERSFPDVETYDGVVVTGSRASVYWDEPWIDEAQRWAGDAVESDTPALGICWGHQLLADAVGGTVESMDEYELGYRTVSHDGADIFEGVPETFTVFTTHSDAVTELPDGADRIAENDYGIQGFRRGNVYGLQSHPEYDPETAEAVARGKDLPEERIESVCAGITDEAYAEARATKRVFDNFCRLAERSAPVADD